MIALVITVIVLLILAGVAIATLTGDNGLLKKAADAKEVSIDGEIGEQIKLAYLEWQTAKMTGTKENANDFIKNSLNSSIGDVKDVTLDNDALTVTILKNNENKIYYYNIEKGAVKQVERTSQSTDIKDSYVGYYADTNEDGIVDGVIFADLLVGNTNGTQWGSSNGTYQISTLEKDVLKKYYISKENHNGIINVVILGSNIGENRFYIMSLNNFETTTPELKKFTWYKSGSGNVDETDTSVDFGTGKTNTKNLMEKWNLNITSQNNSDIWKYLQTKYNEGWFLPSRGEWAAFAKELGITSSNYSSKYNLNDYYWTSSYNNGDGTWRVPFYAGYMYWHGVYDSQFVRLATTF